MDRRDFLRVTGTAAAGIGAVTSVGLEASAQQAPNPRIIDELATPTGETRSISSGGETLWTGHDEDATGEAIYEMGLDSGTITDSLTFKGRGCGGNGPQPVSTNGIGVTDDQLYVLGSEFVLYECTSYSFFVLDRDTKQIADTYNISDYRDMTSDGDSIYVATDELIKELTPATNLVRSIPYPGENINGIAHDGQSFWAAGYDYIWKFNEDGEELAKLSYPREAGADVAHDGDTLWLLQDPTTLLKLDADVQTSTPTPTDTENGANSGVSNSERQQDGNEDSGPDSQDSSNGFGPGIGAGGAVTALAGGAYLKHYFNQDS